MICTVVYVSYQHDIYHCTKGGIYQDIHHDTEGGIYQHIYYGTEGGIYHALSDIYTKVYNIGIYHDIYHITE